MSVLLDEAIHGKRELVEMDGYRVQIYSSNQQQTAKGEALELEEVSRKEAEDGSFILVYLGDGKTGFNLELTWLRDWDRPYNLGDNEVHLAFTVEDFEAAHAKHKEMGCICFENEAMGIYFISDPDGYWLEIVPAR